MRSLQASRGQRGHILYRCALVAVVMQSLASGSRVAAEIIGGRSPQQGQACATGQCPPDSRSPHRGPIENLKARIREPLPHPNTYQDGLAVHAGGAYAGHFQSLDVHGVKHASGCRDGHCQGNCVVRPDRFGFYGTKWRSWPGTMVVQTAGVKELTPETPPKLVLPTVEEESRKPMADVDLGGGDAGDITLPGLGPAIVPEQPARPAAPVLPLEPALPPAEPSPQPPARSEPREEPAPPKPKKAPAKTLDDENLFDEASRRLRLSERLAIANARVVEPPPEPIHFPGAEDATPLSGPSKNAAANVAANVAESAEAASAVLSPPAPVRETPRLNPLRRTLRRPHGAPASGVP